MNRRESGPVLPSVFLVVLNDSAPSLPELEINELETIKSLFTVELTVKRRALHSASIDVVAVGFEK